MESINENFGISSTHFLFYIPLMMGGGKVRSSIKLWAEPDFSSGTDSRKLSYLSSALLVGFLLLLLLSFFFVLCMYVLFCKVEGKRASILLLHSVILSWKSVS